MRNSRKKGFTLIEVMVALGVLSATLLVVNQVVSSSVQQVRLSRNLFYVDTILSEGVSHMDYVQKTNVLRFGQQNFPKCKMTAIDRGLAPDCDDLPKYVGRFILVMEGDFDSQQRAVLSPVDPNFGVVDDKNNPTELVKSAELFQVYEKTLKSGGVVYTNLFSAPNTSAFKKMGYYRYIDVYDNGDFLVTVVYVDELGRLRVVDGNLLSN